MFINRSPSLPYSTQIYLSLTTRFIYFIPVKPFKFNFNIQDKVELQTLKIFDLSITAIYSIEQLSFISSWQEENALMRNIYLRLFIVIISLNVQLLKFIQQRDICNYVFLISNIFESLYRQIACGQYQNPHLSNKLQNSEEKIFKH
ncbi:hypothetical protein TTHERM_001389235 (macronuclear) [Tetrahymena thermophila SB210]|uniref:Uncharacterized protein n=1 Tax=Tetrahymena thermophila (strain SB210) TaxID=312017 RepID=W7XG82_TETTS|nr:hypothetical protein TTHERM_001389235 [Tetrahymena thermophila SB210]EWS75928.1 hypothetical protein TTHERM_001389235 [Tetrahymena thermophila SB210]|eukprot:XP_012651537.1 hypothetical protein TTHERM_001389235 [Tetrahymena thermophila SB210]